MPLMPNFYTPNSIVLGIIEIGRKLGFDDQAIVCAISCALVESNVVMYANERDPESLEYPYQKLSTDENSSGIYQQRDPWWGTARERMSVSESTTMFLESLVKQKPSYKENPGEAIANTQRPDENLRWKYGARMPEAWEWFNDLKDQVNVVAIPEHRPPFNEFPIWSSNNQDRRNTKIDAFFLHTQEPSGDTWYDDSAERVSNWYKNGNGVSYHYAVSQAHDGGVTVVDNVDTDRASWSCGDGNNRSINLVFAGSKASWSAEKWMERAGKAIDVAAYLAVQDCKKYNVPVQVIPPPYTGRLPGISDHNYVTKIIGWGDHTDVGPNFPWAYFAERVIFWATPVIPETEPTEPEAPTFKRFPEDWTDRELLIEVIRQQRGFNLEGWPQLGGRTLVDYSAHLGQKIDALAQAVEELKNDE